MQDKLGNDLHLGDKVYATNVGVAGKVVAIKEYYDKEELGYRNFCPISRVCVEYLSYGEFWYSWVNARNVIVLSSKEGV